MIKFTSGSLFKVISLCKSGRRYSDDTIASMLFPNVKYTTNYIGHVKDCTKNLPDEITQFMRDSNQEEIVSTMKDSVNDVFQTVIIKEKQIFLIAAIQKLLEDDTSIMDSSQIGYLPNYTKGYMKNATTVEPIEFISNALFCVCNQQNNTDGKIGIKQIDESYINNLKKKAESITLQQNSNNSIEENDITIQPTIAGDDYSIVFEDPNRKHIVNIYEIFSHSWKIKNTGVVPWHNRLMLLSNSDSVRVKSTQKAFKIPDLKPNDSVTLKVDMDARYFEGTYTLMWSIRLSDGTLCFPNKEGEFSFDVTVMNNL